MTTKKPLDECVERAFREGVLRIVGGYVPEERLRLNSLLHYTVARLERDPALRNVPLLVYERCCLFRLSATYGQNAHDAEERARLIASGVPAQLFEAADGASWAERYATSERNHHLECGAEIPASFTAVFIHEEAVPPRSVTEWPEANYAPIYAMSVPLPPLNQGLEQMEAYVSACAVAFCDKTAFSNESTVYYDFCIIPRGYSALHLVMFLCVV